MTPETTVAACDSWVREGCRLQAQGDEQASLHCFEEAVRLAPRSVETLIQLGFALIQRREWRRAAETYERLVLLLPKDHRVWCNLSYLYEHAGDLLKAEDRARKAIRLAPASGEAWNNLGMSLRGQHRFPEAVQAFRHALSCQPDLALAGFNLATTFLLLGDGERGWPGYEARKALPEARLRVPAAPRWNGEALPGGRLLIYSDQGLGDAVQFSRFVRKAKERSQGTVIVTCPRELVSFLSGTSGADEVTAHEDEPRDVTAELPLASLPGLFGIDVQAPDGIDPALSAREFELRPPLAEVLREVSPGWLRVGLVWQGNPAQGHDYVRSVRLSRLLPLAEVPGVAWFSLQVNETGRSQIAEVSSRWLLRDVGERLDDFADAAAVLAHLDLVITVDTSLAHVAGALGKRVWTMLGHTPDWRWGLFGESCVWYPTMRLFRQPKWGDWDHVVTQLRHALMAERGGVV